MARKPSGLADASARPEPILPVQDKVPAPARSVKNADAARVGKKMVAGWYDRAAVIQLQRLALDRETTMQDLLGRAIDLLFRDEGLPPLASAGREAVR